jgi:hypothetical protein
MLLTWPMFTFGLIGAAAQVAAHILMYGDGDVARNLIARYTAGMAIIGTAYTAGLLLDPRGSPIAGYWYVAGCSGVAVWACWEWRRKQRMRATAADVARLAGYIGSEHGDDEPRDSD